MDSDLVSIIIPVFNVEPYLQQCVLSAIGQSYKHLEIIIVDDGSTDNSGALCDWLALKDDRLTVYHKENGGLSSARNYGLERANGQFIYFLDSDDYIVPRTIEILLGQINSENLVMVAFGGKCFWDNPVDIITKKQYKEVYRKSRDKYVACSGPQMYIALKDNKEYEPAVPMHFYRASFLKEYQLTFLDGLLHEDELFSTYAYYYAKRVGCCCETLYCRRMRENSIMSTRVSRRNVDSCGTIVTEIMRTMNEDVDATEEQKTMLKRALAHCLWVFFLKYNLLNSGEKKELKEDYRRIESQIRDNHFFDSNEVERCFRRRVLLPLRNNQTIYRLYKFVHG